MNNRRKEQSKPFAVLKQSSSKSQPGPNHLTITSIKKAGKFPWNAELSITVEKSTHTLPEGNKVERCNFVFTKGKKSKIDGISFGDAAKENVDLLQKGKTYIIKGYIEATKRNPKFTQSSLSTSKFELKLGKITIVQEVSQESAALINDCLEQVIVKLQNGRNFNQGFQNLTIKSGQLYRYLGCPTCTTKIQFSDKMGNFVCSKCPKNAGVVKRKNCMILKHIVLVDDSGNELENVVCFNKDCASLLGKQAEEFDHDLPAKILFEDLIGAKIDVTLRREKAKNFLNSWNIIAKSITVVSKRDNKEDEVFYTDSPHGLGDLENGIIDQVKKLEISIRKENNAQTQTSTIEKYEIKTKPPGLALIINNNSFPKREKDKIRDGSEKDVHNIKTLLVALGYEIFENTFTDVTSMQLPEIIKNFKNALTKKEVDSFIFVIMSHGTIHEIDMVDGESVNLHLDILTLFSEEHFPDFIGKPKIFIIEACQQFYLSDRSVNSPPEDVVFSDMLVCLPALPGYLAHRQKSSGSIFIQSLVQVFMKHAGNMDIEKMLKLVHKDLRKYLQKAVRISGKKKRLNQISTHFPLNFSNDFYFQIN